MCDVSGRCVHGPNKIFEKTTINRRLPGSHDVLIDILYCGICQTDIMTARNAYGTTKYPLVPGHEISGIVSAIGSSVSKFKIGDRVGVGCYLATCGDCLNCRRGEENNCSGIRVTTYNSVDESGAVTQGGYSQKIVVNEQFVLTIPDRLDLQSAAPLLCGGITMYTPLINWRVKPGSRVGIVGCGGLGHIGLQMAKAMGAEVTIFEKDADKCENAMLLGADNFVLVEDNSAAINPSSLDLILTTVPCPLDQYLNYLDMNGTLVNIVPYGKITIDARSLMVNRRSLAGTRTGNLKQTQEMLDYCATHNIKCEVEVISADHIDEAYRRVLIGDVRFRFVIDGRTF